MVELIALSEIRHSSMGRFVNEVFVPSEICELMKYNLQRKGSVNVTEVQPQALTDHVVMASKPSASHECFISCLLLNAVLVLVFQQEALVV